MEASDGKSQTQCRKSTSTHGKDDFEVFRLQKMKNVGITMKTKATELLRSLGVKSNPGRLNPGLGNCLFESIIWQIEDLKRFEILRRWNPQVETGESWLRQKLITLMNKMKGHLEDYYPHQGEHSFEEMVQELSMNGGWNNDLADLVVTILPRVVKAPILLIILTDGSEDKIFSKYFPETDIGEAPDDMGLTEDPLVIIYYRNHYEHLLVSNSDYLRSSFLNTKWPCLSELHGENSQVRKN